MNIGAIIIGDELLSGKRQDQHFNYLQQTLSRRGLELTWTIIVGDDPLQLERFLRFSFESQDLVFSFGGIGATPDDRTRQTVAKVINTELYPHPEAVKEIEAQFGKTAYPNRILMGHLPRGSQIIPNPINRVPGFSYQQHYFMPGFPEMSWPMVEWILDNCHPTLRNQTPEQEQIIYILQARESDLLTTMNQIVNDFPSLKLSSLPHMSKQPHIELSLRGPVAQVEKAMAGLKHTIEKAELKWTTQRPKV